MSIETGTTVACMRGFHTTDPGQGVPPDLALRMRLGHAQSSTSVGCHGTMWDGMLGSDVDDPVGVRQLSERHTLGRLDVFCGHRHELLWGFGRFQCRFSIVLGCTPCHDEGRHYCARE